MAWMQTHWPPHITIIISYSPNLVKLGSIDKIIKPGQTILIKPNLAFNAPPESYAVIDPSTIESVTRYFKKHSKAGKILVGDNSSLGQHVGWADIAIKTSGMEEAANLGGQTKSSTSMCDPP